VKNIPMVLTLLATLLLSACGDLPSAPSREKIQPVPTVTP
jgi:hypothetical protein